MQIGILGNQPRQENDLYSTHPMAVEHLLHCEEFAQDIWEPCNGLSHISNTLERFGYNVSKSDIIPYFEGLEIIDFLQFNGTWHGDIITNPPFKDADEMVYKALETIQDGHKVAMYMKINFLASQKRKQLFTDYPPKKVYIMSQRFSCARNGDFEHYGRGAMDYVWIVWEKGYKGPTVMRWIA